jgi:Golgi-resident PAP phosphatase
LEGPNITVSMSHAGKAQEMAKIAFGEKAHVIPAAGAGKIILPFVKNPLMVWFAGYKVMEVVKGKADIYLHSTIIKKWDLCAGSAILHSMGGTMTDLKGNEIDFSASGSPVNKGGILATLAESEYFLEKIANPSLNQK